VQQVVLIAQLLTLLAIANGVPVIAAKLLGKEHAIPLDGNATLSDGKRLFGSSKTLRGVILSGRSPLRPRSSWASDPWWASSSQPER
jgi:hypothetical protein